MTQTIVLGGGCFWCLDAVFSQVAGVLSVECGYANGQTSAPTYEQVCSGQTGHAEVVKVTFEPEKISLAILLAIFFAIHDPTTPNRQGHDVGSQYRSAIYWQTPEQEQQARQVVANLAVQALFPAPIVTELAPLNSYYPAEQAHQRYYERNPQAGYCAYVIAPKLDTFRQHFQAYMQPAN